MVGSHPTHKDISDKYRPIFILANLLSERFTYISICFARLYLLKQVEEELQEGEDGPYYDSCS
jgi:hypothetical protein